MNMIKSSEVVKIFLDYEISTTRDEKKYIILPLKGITNNTAVVDVDNKKFVLRIPGKNPDVINRRSEKYNSIQAYEAGLTLPFIIFDENTGIKISEYFDIYTYKQPYLLRYLRIYLRKQVYIVICISIASKLLSP